MKKTYGFIITILVLCSFAMAAESSWTFVGWADPHYEAADLTGNNPAGTPAAEGYPDATQGYNGTSDLVEQHIADRISQMAAHNPEAVLIPGDLASYRFDSDWAKAAFAPGGTYEETIQNAADIYNGQWYYRFASQMPLVLIAVGDHEIGDNNWNVGQPISYLVDDFRLSLAQTFNMDATGNFRFDDPIGSVSSRPLGTPYENTSYAKQVRNALFISVDVFRQDSPEKQLNIISGSVTADVSGSHLTWLENVLDAAENESSIDHVFVLGHTPVLEPVRKWVSSGMMFDERGDSDFWSALRRCSKVRAYFAGEVHTETASKDTESDILQIVHKGYLKADVYEDKVEFTNYRFQNTSAGYTEKYWSKNAVKSWNKKAAPEIMNGSIIADYSGSKASFTASGILELMDQKGLLVHYSFDDELEPKITNHGSMKTEMYGGVKQGVSFGSGIMGTAGVFNSDAHLTTKKGIAPVTGSEPRTVSAWIKTASSDHMTIGGWGGAKGGIQGKFNFDLNNGKIGLSAENTQTRAAGSPDLADGKWHHVAAAFPGRPEGKDKFKDLIFYVDGQKYPAATDSEDILMTSGSVNNLYVGKAARDHGPYFEGSIDEFAIWGSKLSDGKIESLFAGAESETLGYNASDMEKLFDLFNQKSGSVFVKGRRWQCASGLPGSPGDLVTHNSEPAFVLDQQGNGVVGEITDMITILQQPEDAAGIDGKEITLSVSAVGAEPIEYQWYHSQDSARSEDDQQAGSESTIELALSQQNEGFYYCKLQNPEGSAYTDIVSVRLANKMAHWTLDNDSSGFDGSSYLDISSYGEKRDAVVEGSADFADGACAQLGQSAFIQKNDGYAYAGPWNPLETTGKMTMTMWLKWKENLGNWQVVTGKKDSDGELYRLSIKPDESLLNLGKSSGAKVFAPGPLPEGEWVFVAFTLDSTAADPVGSIYMITEDEGLKTSYSETSLGVKTDADFGVGSVRASSSFNGWLDDVRVYDDVLDQNSITTIYYQSCGKPVCNPDSLLFDTSGPNGEPDCIVNLYDYASLCLSWLDCSLLPSEACSN
ncbi:LamG-like jellyroll fold domain-containing protein [Sedimentisphaera salicampi]|uniref:LamG-like jellyroll fold domain-containing protein n=1 Tax=Sedimentisphaera salicampi TaxID=1941349 RepID=UPI000B9B158E|nr:LamG-like jellyroll fold domain-containing protein [Sedimentisphaera salicampi]OXU15430.1 hypothetical protein SMSP1_00911 [Sedimentisphaera salicampi]